MGKEGKEQYHKFWSNVIKDSKASVNKQITREKHVAFV